MTPADPDLFLLCRLCELDPDDEALQVRWRACGGLRGLWTAGPAALLARNTPGFDRLEDWLALTRALLRGDEGRECIDDPASVVAHVGPWVALEPQEGLWGLPLDGRGRSLGLYQVARGTLTACLVHPREVFAPALRLRAHSLVVVHNHPSGDPTPSLEDRQLTDRLVEAGQLLGIPVVDHVVVARSGFRSLGGLGCPGSGTERDVGGGVRL